MSQGVAQIKNIGLTGILAVNIDDLLPLGVLVEPNIHVARAVLGNYNLDFLARFESSLSGYASTGRVAAVMASSWAPMDLEKEGITSCREMHFWIHPALDSAQKAHIREFEEALFAGAPKLQQ